jgi:hypothetical protein
LHLWCLKMSILFLNETQKVATDNCYCLWGNIVVNKDKFTNLVQQISASLRIKLNTEGNKFLKTTVQNDVGFVCWSKLKKQQRTSK